LLLSAGKRLNEKETAALTAIADNGLFGGNDWPADYLEEADSQVTTMTRPNDKLSQRWPGKDTPGHRFSMMAGDNKDNERSFYRRSTEKNAQANPSFSTDQQLENLLLTEMVKNRPLPVCKNQPRPSIEDRRYPGELQKIRRLHAQSLADLSAIYKALAAYQAVSLIEVRNVIIPFVDVMTLDADLIPALIGEQIEHRGGLVPHALDVSLLAMSMATQMGLNRRQILELGMGALLHDTGMVRIPRPITHAPRSLTSGERRAVQQHPRYTLNYLQSIRDLSPAARLIAFQLHERPNGSGYPEQRQRNMIHPLAHIASIADAYIALSSPRPWRPAVKPYSAIKTVLDGVRAGLFEKKSAQALLNSVGLFPVGSHVQLNTGQSARVLRTNPNQKNCPTVQLLSEGAQGSGDRVNLSRTEAVWIVSAQ
jgi:HD-GYP domain-containing protein (c-di-GMP phosphodiesterase class II)